MASNKTMLYGLLISFSVHASAFIYWKTDFKFAKTTDFTQNIKNEIGIKLVKYTQPIKQTVKTVPKQKKTSLSSQNIQHSTPTINKTKTKFPIKEISKKLPPSTKVASKNNKKKDTTDNNSKQIEEKNKEEINKQNNILSDKKAQQLKEKLAKQLLSSTQLEEKENYIKKLLAHIESFKFYPGVARRRSIEGTLKVSFKLLSEGQLSQLTINGGKAILQRAARQALDDAMPLPTPPASFDANQYIEFNMVFTLSGSALSGSHSVETVEKP